MLKDNPDFTENLDIQTNAESVQPTPEAVVSGGRDNALTALGAFGRSIAGLTLALAAEANALVVGATPPEDQMQEAFSVLEDDGEYDLEVDVQDGSGAINKDQTEEFGATDFLAYTIGLPEAPFSGEINASDTFDNQMVVDGSVTDAIVTDEPDESVDEPEIDESLA